MRNQLNPRTILYHTPAEHTYSLYFLPRQKTARRTVPGALGPDLLGQFQTR